MAHVLVVDDEPKLGRVVAQMLELDGHSIALAGGGRDALAHLGQAPFDVVITDLRMPEVDGLAVLQAARATKPPPEVFLMTAHGTAESAVAAMKAGAADYVTKPFSMDELRLRVGRLAAQRASELERARLVARLTPDLVAVSPRHGVSARRRPAGRADGRERAPPGRERHRQEPARPGHPLPGPAGGGTLFLDEIGEVTPVTQVSSCASCRTGPSCRGAPPRRGAWTDPTSSDQGSAWTPSSARCSSRPSRRREAARRRRRPSSA